MLVSKLHPVREEWVQFFLFSEMQSLNYNKRTP